MTGLSSLDEMDKNMVDMFKNGDYSDYRKLYDKYAPAVLGVFIRTLGDRKLAEDCVKASFCEIWMQRLTYDPDKERLFTWMLKIAKTCSICAPLAEKNYVDSEIREEIDLVYATDIKAYLTGKKSAEGEGFGLGVSEEIKEAINLIYFKGLSFAVAAEELGISVEMLRGKMIKTIKQLKGSVLT